MKQIYLDTVKDMTLDECLKEYEKHRSKIKHPVTPLGLKMALKKAKNYANNDEEIKALLIQSIDRGWRGVFDFAEESNSLFDEL